MPHVVPALACSASPAARPLKYRIGRYSCRRWLRQQAGQQLIGLIPRYVALRNALNMRRDLRYVVIVRSDLGNPINHNRHS